jgi:predicted RNA-binding protein (virulence factor B family)
MQIGEINLLKILRFTAPGAYLGDEDGNDVLLPGKYITNDMSEEDMISVFLYRDSEDRIVATTETPLIHLYGYAYLKVKEVNLYGAFLDWGLEKDLMVPFKEQQLKMEEGKYYLVTLQMDGATDRLFATTKINRYLEECSDKDLVGQEVELLVCDKTELGVKLIVDERYHGMVFQNDISKPIRRGQKIRGFVLNVRDDGKLDIRFEKIGFEKFDDAAQSILEIVKSKGSLYLSDKSSPEDIREQVGMSKKTFKQAIGKLYKARQIEILDTEIRLITDSSSL